ncbi:Beta-lactamase [Xanthomonas sacchari]|uniref:class C beta-lactamase n=1 Tax=Xanthomonas sacchari TaxID=56458 RepID=UPI00225DFAA2|nr:class C beta-lactamase [Xanthomonas sacchari]MCW0459092.1 Beta-lactamase [Xanthomonas sacchari]
MKRLLGFCLLFVAAISSAKDAPTSRADAEKQLQHTVQAFMTQYDVPGVAIAMTVDGTDYYATYGVSSRTTQAKIGKDTLFEIGSISKTFTATLAAYAQVNHKLSLMDHPSKYLPEMKGHDFDKVTLLNLGTHTAGGFPMQMPEDVKSDAQVTAYFQAWKPQYPAGTKRTYANPSIGMLGLITAKSMHVPFRKAMEDILLPRLALPNTYLYVPPGKQALYAQGYDENNVPARMKPGALWEPTYGIKTTAKDLLRFVEINLGLIEVQPALRRAIEDTHTGYFKLGDMTQDLVWEQIPYPTTQNALLTNSSQKVIYESNAVEVLKPPLQPQQNVLINKTGSTRGFGAYVAFNPSNRIGIVLLINRNISMEARLSLASAVLDVAHGLQRAPSR